MTDQYSVRDGGSREQFNTGAVREQTTGKGRFDLIPLLGLPAVAAVAEKGALKYADRNWEKGMPLSRFLDSAQRHIIQLFEGDTVEDHAGHAAWNMLAFIHMREMINRGLLPAELDDLPNYMPKDNDL